MHRLAPLAEDDALAQYNAPPLYAPHMSASLSNSFAPLQHPPLCFILVIVLSSPHAIQSTAALKACVIKTSLDFTFASLSPCDRLGIVTFEVGTGGKVRRRRSF